MVANTTRIDALFAEATQTDELTAHGLAEWACPFCEKPEIVSGADDMILHVKMEHPKQLRNFCTSHGISYDDVQIRLGEKKEKKAPAQHKVEAPAPAPVEQPQVDAKPEKPKSNVKPCVCGYVGTDSKDAGAHKRQCVVWKAEMGKAPVGESKKSDEELLELFTQAINSLAGLSNEAGKDVQVYENLEAKRAQISKWEEVKPTILPFVKLGYGTKEFEICEQVFRELKVRLELQAVTNDAYKRGQKAHDLLLETRIANRKVMVQECSDHNAEFEAEVADKANAWIDIQAGRFEALLHGRQRVQGVSDVLTFVHNVNWRVSSEVSKLAKAKEYSLADERSICEKHARLALEAVGFPASKIITHDGVRKDVNDDGEIIEAKHRFEQTAVLPIQSWAHKITDILLFVRKVYRQTSGKVDTNTAMQTEEFAAKFGFNLEEQDDELEIAHWRVNGQTKADKPKYDKGETAMGAALKDAGVSLDDMLRNSSRGGPNQVQPKRNKRGKKSRK
jgi:hypothetical protein